MDHVAEDKLCLMPSNIFTRYFVANSKCIVSCIEGIRTCILLYCLNCYDLVPKLLIVIMAESHFVSFLLFLQNNYMLFTVITT